HSIFIILAVITALILVGVYFVLPNGKLPDSALSLHPKAVMGSFFTVLRQPQFLTYSLVGGIATAAPFAYLAGSSDVFMNIYHVSAQEYGWIFAFLAIALIAPTQLNQVLLKRFTNEQIISTTLVYQSIVGLLLVLGTWAGWYGQYGLIGMLFLFLAGQGLTSPNASALSLAPFTRHAGSAAALMGSFRMGFGSIISASVSLLHNNTAIPMVGIMTLCAVIGLIILLVSERVIRYQSRPSTMDEQLTEAVL
ncbi:MAG: Bcr/CflA family drug resistance efflux transporter, partial [Cytophagaceae bacterium]